MAQRLLLVLVVFGLFKGWSTATFLKFATEPYFVHVPNILKVGEKIILGSSEEIGQLNWLNASTGILLVSVFAISS